MLDTESSALAMHVPLPVWAWAIQWAASATPMNFGACGGVSIGQQRRARVRWGMDVIGLERMAGKVDLQGITRKEFYRNRQLAGGTQHHFYGRP